MQIKKNAEMSIYTTTKCFSTESMYVKEEINEVANPYLSRSRTARCT